MHDLNTIARLNEDAFQKGINTDRSLGKFVVLHKTGLHVVSYDNFNTLDAATGFLAACAQLDSPDVQRVLLEPDASLVGLRDQSEDREAA